MSYSSSNPRIKQLLAVAVAVGQEGERSYFHLENNLLGYVGSREGWKGHSLDIQHDSISSKIKLFKKD